MTPPRETDLYPPIKAFLEAQGYQVKAEVAAADVVAVRGDEEPVVVELKLSFSLSLFHQAVARLTVSENVYVAVLHQPGKPFARALKRNLALARRLGLGVATVRLRDGLVQVHCDPGAALPRRSRTRQAALLREFARRKGDPNIGGQPPAGLVTAYRQDAVRIARHLHEHGVSRGADVARSTGIPRATRMMRDNHYGWFENQGRGKYTLSKDGAAMVSASPG